MKMHEQSMSSTDAHAPLPEEPPEFVRPRRKGIYILPNGSRG